MMVSKMAEMITALVLLSGSGDPAVQARRVDDAKAGFERLGFRTETIAGGNLSITGSKADFEKTFKVEMDVKKAQPARVKSASGVSSVLPLSGLPASIRENVQAIEFEKDLDFGPGNF